MRSPVIEHARKLVKSGESTVHSSHAVGVLETGDEALFARVHAIRAADRAIDVQTFIWANDESGRYVFWELLQAARRGVVVRILIDAWVSLGPPKLLAFMGLAHPNISVKYYNPSAERLIPSTLDLISAALSDFGSMNHRMHNKAFIIDGQLAIVGGRNYQNDYYDRGATRNFRDRELLVIGPEVQAVQSSFDGFWDCDLSLPPERLADLHTHLPAAGVAYSDRDSFELDMLFDALEERLRDCGTASHFAQEKLRRVDNIKYVSDIPCSPINELNLTLKSIVTFFSSAKQYLLLQSPYFVLDPVHFQALKDLRAAHPDLPIQVSTNSLASTDNVVAYAHSYRERVHYLAELLLQIHEMKPQPADLFEMLAYHRADEPGGTFTRSLDNGNADGTPLVHLCCHAKTFVRDDEAVWLGSSNVDPRSAWLNSENGFIVNDSTVAREVAQRIRNDIRPKNSWTVGFADDAPATAALRDLLLSITPDDTELASKFLRFPENFELKPGNEIVPFFHSEFYKRFESLGAFPLVAGGPREISVRLISLLPDATKAWV